MSRSLTKRFANKIAERDDGWFCHYCGCQLVYGKKSKMGNDPNDPWWPVLDHVIPSSNGGTDNIENLVLACPPCNNKKGARSYTWAIDHLST